MDTQNASYRTTALIILGGMTFGVALWTGVAYGIGWLISWLG
jgi:hypothetical protein